MTEYWVVGGEYADTRFAKLAPGRALERYGPFASYQDARAEWQKRAWATVDDCQVRYTIVEDQPAKQKT